MKKVLSVLLAAAMVMGMTVSASAANFFGPEEADKENNTNVANIYFDRVTVVDEDGHVKANKVKDVDYGYLAAGDTMYFQMMGMETDTCDAQPCWHADENWMVKVSHDEFVEDCSIIYTKATSDEVTKYGLDKNASFVKVVISDDFDHFVEEGVDFYFYIFDTKPEAGYGKKSETAYVMYDFEEYRQVVLCADDCEEDGCTHSTKASAPKYVKFEANGHYIPVEFDDPAEYILCDKCFTTSKEVVFAATSKDGDEVLFEGKMIPGEEYLTAVNYKFDKALTKAYDVDMTVLTIDTEMKVNAIFESAKDNKVVLEVVDGELYEVESEFVTKYEVIKDEKLVKGYKVENIDNGTFVLVDADADLEWEDATRKEVVEAPVADDKANPSTGANDFVGAAVALAVVSVAAAGALAFKK